jgi:hypothetical protein
MVIRFVERAANGSPTLSNSLIHEKTGAYKVIVKSVGINMGVNTTKNILKLLRLAALMLVRECEVLMERLRVPTFYRFTNLSAVNVGGAVATLKESHTRLIIASHYHAAVQTTLRIYVSVVRGAILRSETNYPLNGQTDYSNKNPLRRVFNWACDL